MTIGAADRRTLMTWRQPTANCHVTKNKTSPVLTNSLRLHISVRNYLDKFTIILLWHGSSRCLLKHVFPAPLDSNINCMTCFSFTMAPQKWDFTNRASFCGRRVARVSATLVIDVRVRFISADCRLYRLWKRCSVCSVVLEKVVLSRWCFVLWWTGREKVRQGPARIWHGRPDDGFFQAHKDDTAFRVSWATSTHVICACEKTAVFVMHASGVCSVLPHPRRIVGTTFRQSETACKKMSLTALRSALKNATTMNSNFAMKNSAMMRTTKTKYAAGFPAPLFPISILFSDQQRNHILHFLRIADSDFDACVCSLVIRDILFLLRHNLGVVVEVVEVLQHLSREPNALNFVFVQLS